MEFWLNLNEHTVHIHIKDCRYTPSSGCLQRNPG